MDLICCTIHAKQVDKDDSFCRGKVAYTVHTSITTSNPPHSDESRYRITGRCHLLWEKIAALGHMLIMCPCKTTQVYLTNMKLPVLPGYEVTS